MPIFEFACATCGNIFEKIVYGKSEAVSCDKCGSSELTKLFPRPSSLSGAKTEGGLPGPGDTGCRGGSPSSKGCVPGSCCGRAIS